eukprot:m.194731 g.194731  ORF g.194731 m.194731 type:complete len:357 (-) comp18660_c0_seq1:352-1422(-)
MATSKGSAVYFGVWIALIGLIPTLVDRILLFPGVPVIDRGGVVVTGASTGIGRDAAVYLAEQGYTVYGGVRKQTDADALKKLGGSNIIPVILDVTISQEITAAASFVENDLKSKNIDLVALVNNAGMSKPVPLEANPMTLVKQVYGVNVFGLIETTQAFLPQLRNTGAGSRIVNIGSVAGLLSVPLSSTYAGTKHAVEAISDSLRQEVGQFGIQVALVEPALVESEIHNKASGIHDELDKMSPEHTKLYAEHVKWKRTYESKNLDMASPTSVTTEAITHAITSPFPQTRYRVANVGGIPASILVPPLRALPDRLRDYLLFSGAANPLKVYVFIISGAAAFMVIGNRVCAFAASFLG